MFAFVVFDLVFQS